MSIVMVTTPHGRILINASPGVGANMELVETPSLCVCVGEVDGLRNPDEATMRKVLRLLPGASPLEVPVVPIIEPPAPTLRR